MSARADGIAAIVVAHDSGSVLAHCIARLGTAAGVSEIVIVDNASVDGAPAAAAASVPGVRVLRNADNRGFAAACNQGVAATHAPWIAFVNPDCFVEPGILAQAIAIARGDPAIGLVGVEVVDADGAPEPATRRADPTLRRVLGEYAARLGLPVRERLYLEPAGAAVETVDAVSGALMVLPRAVHAAVGGLDEGYRLHVEDLDLCRRVRAAGWRVVLASGLKATHLKGTSSRARPCFVAWHKHRGIARYWRRHGAGGGAPGTWVAIAAVWLHFALLLPRCLFAALRAPRAPVVAPPSCGA